MTKFKLPVQTSPYVMLSSDYSQQEPALTSTVSADPNMIKAFQEGKDIYATIASIAFGVPYEQCLEFHPETHEYQKEGKARRGEAKTIVLGICYGRSVVTIGDQLYGTDKTMTQEEKTAKAQKVYDSVLNAFPNLRKLMISSQKQAATVGYVQTILGRRRHIPDMMLPEFEFVAMPGYVNPDIDPLDPETLKNKSDIPERIVNQLKKEFAGYKYYGQIAKRTKELKEEKIKVINNRRKITDASRQCVNCVDEDTEILTLSGWKRYDEVHEGDMILSYDLDKQSIVKDSIKEVHEYSGSFDVVNFKSPTFDAVSTLEHRWVCQAGSEKPRFITTEHIERNRWPDYPILRVADNLLESTCCYSDDELKLIGYLLTDGCYTAKPYSMHIYQSTTKTKNTDVYYSMLDLLNRLNLKYNDYIKDNVYHEIYINKCLFSDSVIQCFPNRCLTFEFVSSLNQHQADILMWSMIEGDGTLGEDQGNITYTCNSLKKADVFQYLAFVAGHATNMYETAPEKHNNYPSSNRVYESTCNQNPIQITQSYYTVNVMRIKRAQIYPHHKSRSTVSFIWCVTTGTGSWVARRHGKVFITGNSVIQGSAADTTKMAILLVENDPEWQKLGGRLLVPVHDELVCEVPMENWQRAGDLLSSLMCKAADFMPFHIHCDVETSLRWYGLEYPCPYPKPQDIDTDEPDEVCWIQYHLFEMEYILPVYKDENGDEPRGNAAKGISGRVSEEYWAAISDYMIRYKINKDEFINHIEVKVRDGITLTAAQVASL